MLFRSLEVKVLLTYKTGEELTSARLQANLHYKEDHANQAFSWLAGKNLVQVHRKEMHTYYKLTELGFSFAKNRQPAKRIFNFVRRGIRTSPQARYASGYNR